MSSHEKWLAGLADLLVEHGVVTGTELASGAPEPAQAALKARALPAGKVANVLASGGPTRRAEGAPPRFAVGDRVRTRPRSGNAWVPGGHTRLPDYAANATGQVIRTHGAHVLPDSNAHGRGEAPEALYAVEFSATELWPTRTHPLDVVVLDLWDSYLELA